MFAAVFAAMSSLLLHAASGSALQLSRTPTWTLNSADDDSVSGSSSPAAVRVPNCSMPSLVQLDLHRAGIIGDPFVGTNLDDGTLRWVHEPARNWTYSTTFATPSPSDGGLLLVAQSLDTLATVRLNGAVVASSSNVHVRLTVVLPPTLLRRNGAENVLAISFADPVTYSIAQHALHPCECPTCCEPFFKPFWPIYAKWEGRPWIRKTQSDYGWNWGPPAMPYGVPKDIFLVPLGATEPVLEDMRVTVLPAAGLPKARLDDKATDFHVSLELQIRAHVAIPAGRELLVHAAWSTEASRTALPALAAGVTTVTVTLTATKPALWWPRELLLAAGNTRAVLYNITASLPGAAPPASTHEEFGGSLRRRVGFRTAELVLDAARDGNGTIFAWRVNGVLLFIRGANVIPYDAFQTEARVGRQQYESTLSSVAAAHMNMVRVWGGGSYLGSDFYDVADEMGILVWQEVMFACAVYPAWPEFTASVREEIVQQTRRLSAHPSIVLWCGNNEAETMKMDAYEGAWAQYYSLAYDVIIDTLKNVTQGIELWPSSPSNGFQTSWSDPEDVTRGDVHHYVYDGDCTDSSLYEEMPRFQSEFGFPSYPGETELAPFVADEATDLKTHSLFHIARQDLNCPLSNATTNVSGYETSKKVGCDFPMQERLLPSYSSKGWDDQSLTVWRQSLYSGQITQALCIQAQAEHFRRGRDTPAQTAGYLVWQLNSEWPGASKSSLQYDGGWKALHHFSARFNEPFHLSGYLTDRYHTVNLHLANDGWQGTVQATWSLSVWRWADGKAVKRNWCPVGINCTVGGLPASSGKPLLSVDVAGLLKSTGEAACEDKTQCFIVAEADGKDAAGAALHSAAFLPLGAGGLRDAPLSATAEINVTVHPDSSVSLVSNAVVPHAFLRLKPLGYGQHYDDEGVDRGVTMVGRFSENALLLLPGEPQTVRYLSASSSGGGPPPMTADELRRRLTVDCLNRLGGCVV